MDPTRIHTNRPTTTLTGRPTMILTGRPTTTLTNRPTTILMGLKPVPLRPARMAQATTTKLLIATKTLTGLEIVTTTVPVTTPMEDPKSRLMDRVTTTTITMAQAIPTLTVPT